jgi:hypothetical protein
MTQDRDKLRALVNEVMSLWGSIKCWEAIDLVASRVLLNFKELIKDNARICVDYDSFPVFCESLALCLCVYVCVIGR